VISQLASLFCHAVPAIVPAMNRAVKQAIDLFSAAYASNRNANVLFPKQQNNDYCIFCANTVLYRPYFVVMHIVYFKIIILQPFTRAKVCRYRQSAGGSRLQRHLKGVSFINNLILLSRYVP